MWRKLKKMKYLMFIVLATAFVSCKKDQQGSILGKWQLTKLELYQENANLVLYDTTYLHPFTGNDYIQFNSDGTCIGVTDHNYYVNAPGNPKVPQAISPFTATWDYTASGSVYILTQTPAFINFGFLATADTVSINGNTLLQHVVTYNINDPLQGLKTVSNI